MSKKTRGQFYTTNYKYVLQNLEIPETIQTVIEPFAGKGDLLRFVDNKYTTELKYSALLEMPEYNWFRQIKI